MPKTLKHEVKADFLLDKGMALLWSKGYNATSVNDIVKEAGIPKGSFYFYFKSKEDFVVRALEKYFSSNLKPALEILQNKSISPKQRLLNFYEFRIEMLKNELDCKMGCMACNLSSEMAEHNEAIRKLIAGKTKMIRSYITEVVEEAQEYNEINSSINASDIVEFMEDAGKGAMISMKEMKSAYPIENVLNMIRTFLLK